MPTVRAKGRRNKQRLPSMAKSWLRIKNPYPPVLQFSEDQIEAIHCTSLTLLRDKGMRVLSKEARGLYASAGAIVDEETRMVRFDPDMVLQLVQRSPYQFSMHGRAPERWFDVGGNNLVFATVGGPPHYSDLEGGRRAGTLDTFQDLLRLAQNYDVLHLTTPMVEPQDVPIHLRHLHMARAVATLTDKPSFIYSRGRQAVADSLEIFRMAMGMTVEEFEERVHC